MSYIYILRRFRERGWGGGWGSSYLPWVSLIKFSFFSKIIVCYIFAPDEQLSYHDLRY